MLLQGDYGALAPDQKEIIEKLKEKNATLIYLVDDLLDMAKVEETGKSPYHCEEASIEDVIVSVINFSQDQIKMKKIFFTFEKPNMPLPKMMLDKEKMFLVIKNLLDNAVKYSPDGQKVTISLTTDWRNALIAVRDFGIGVPKSEKGRLFTKFFRAPNAKKTDGGSGLGLFIAKNIIEAHRGKIWFESTENKGSTFYIELPLA